MSIENNTKVGKYEARPYQVEIVEKALRQNAIVCLGTGTGKTFISATVIKELQGGITGTYETKGKRTFFLVNTVPLVSQQSQVIEDTTCLKVKGYTGEMGVDFWDKDMWRAEFNKYDVLVMTCQILVNILSHAFITLENINLLVLDECHNASKKHPYAQLLVYHDRCPKHNQPHILGLTASIINQKYKKGCNREEIRSFLQKKMKELEARMRSVCITCADVRATEKYATKPIEIVKTYSLSRANGELGNLIGPLVTSLIDASETWSKI